MIDRVEPTVAPAAGDAAEDPPEGSPDAVTPIGGGDGAPVASAGSQDGPMGSTAPPLVDPAVSRQKFDREIQHFRAMESEYLRRGWILVRAEYPEVVVLFAASHLTPPAVVLGVRLDFTNFDFWPPSVRFVKPFTLEPLTAPEMPTRLWKRTLRPDGSSDVQPLLQAHQDQVPFICARGVREYHHHPEHSNDPWLAYRGTGVGTLYHVLNLIHRHGIAPMTQYAVQLQFNFGFPPPNVLPADVLSIPE